MPAVMHPTPTRAPTVKGSTIPRGIPAWAGMNPQVVFQQPRTLLLLSVILYTQPCLTWHTHHLQALYHQPRPPGYSQPRRSINCSVQYKITSTRNSVSGRRDEEDNDAESVDGVYILYPYNTPSPPPRQGSPRSHHSPQPRPSRSGPLPARWAISSPDPHPSFPTGRGLLSLYCRSPREARTRSRPRPGLGKVCRYRIACPEVVGLLVWKCRCRVGYTEGPRVRW